MILKSLVQCFEMASGLKVNWEKSHMLGIYLSDSKCSLLANLLDCSYKERAFEDFGLPLGGYYKRASGITFWIDAEKDLRIGRPTIFHLGVGLP